MKDPRARVLLVVAALLCAVAAVTIGATATPTDFLVWYCHGRLSDLGQDAYLVEPLRACEHHDYEGDLLGGIVIPATMPAYATLPFRALALLPFGVARAIFTVGELAAVATTIVVLRRSTGAPLVALAGVLVVADLYVSLLTGQIATFAIAAAALCASALARDRPRDAGAWAIAAMIEPHLGLPVLATVALCVPKTRATIAAGLALLAGITLLSPRAGDAWEYASGLLPALLRSELHLDGQIGVAHLMTLMGLPDAAAMRVASAVYLAATAGVGALLWRSRERGRPFLVAGPLAVGIAAAPYGHVTQCCAAIPALVILAVRARGLTVRTLAAIALAILAVPLITLGQNGTNPAIPAAFAVAAGIAAATIARLSRSRAILLAAANGTFVFAIARLASPDPVPPPGLSRALLGVAATDLSPHVWQRYVEASLTLSSPASVLAKTGTWMALGLTVALSVLWCLDSGIASPRPDERAA